MSTSGRLPCILASHTGVPIPWMCEKLSAVSLQQCRSWYCFIGRGFAKGGSPALQFGERALDSESSKQAGKNTLIVNEAIRSLANMFPNSTLSHPFLDSIDREPSNVPKSLNSTELCVFEDDSSVVHMSNRRRAPTIATCDWDSSR